MTVTQVTGDITDPLGSVIYSGRQVIAEERIVAACGHVATAQARIPLMEGVPDLADMDGVDRRFLDETARDAFRQMSGAERCEECRICRSSEAGDSA